MAGLSEDNANDNFEDNLSAKGIILRYASKPRRGLFVLLPPIDFSNAHALLIVVKRKHSVRITAHLPLNKFKLVSLLDLITL